MKTPFKLYPQFFNFYIWIEQVSLNILIDMDETFICFKLIILQNLVSAYYQDSENGFFVTPGFRRWHRKPGVI